MSKPAEENTASGQQAVAAEASGESLYMDVEEAELLHRFTTDNPNMVTFKETDDRVRTLEERFPESELEKLVIRANQLLAKRKEAMVSDDRVQPLPLHPKVPSVLQLRELRSALIESNSQISTHEPFVNIADVLAKEVALSEESRANLPYALATLETFFKGETDRLPRKLLKYLQRYEQLVAKDSECAIAFRSSVQERLTKVADQLAFAKHAADAIGTYASLYAAEARIGAGRTSAGETTDDARHSAQATNARLAEELHPLYFRYYVADQSIAYRTTRRLERFVSRAQLIPLHKRYDMYADVMTHLIGGQPAVGAEVNQTVPLLAKQETTLSDQLDHLCSCFRIPHNETSSDLQQFAYHVNRKYHLVFAAQNEEWTFKEDYHAGTASGGNGADKGSVTAKHGGKEHVKGSGATPSEHNATSADNVVILRQSTWTQLKNIDPIPPAWQASQDVKVLAVPLTTEGGRQIHAEMEYLKEQNVQVSSDRWKVRTESMYKRLEHRKGPLVLGNLSGAVDNDDSGAPDMASIGKLIAANPLLQKHHAAQQLRFIRSREFRRKILDILNVFASVLRMVAQDSAITRSVAHSATGLTAIKVHPIGCDAAVERDRALMTAAVQGVDTLHFVEPDTFATHMLRLHHDGVVHDLNLDAMDLKDSATAAGRKKSTAAFSQDGGSDHASSTTSKYPPASLGDVLSKASTSHLDTVEVVDGKITVRRGFDGAVVIDKWALDELQRIETWIAKVGTYFVDQFNNATYPETTGLTSHVPTAGGGSGDGATVIDYTIVVEDLLEAECWFTEGKMKVLNAYREAYEQCTDAKRLHQIASTMIAIIRQRPRVDFSDAYFAGSYTREVVNLELHHALLREIVQSQLADERRINAHAAPQPKTGEGATGGPHGERSASRSGSVFSTAGSTKAGGHHAVAGGSNAPSMAGARVKPSETHEFPSALQRSMQQRSTVDPVTFGLPEAPINDPRLYFSMHPGSSVVNMLDVCRSLDQLASIPALVEHACRQLSERFNISQYPSALQVLEKEVFQELLVQWRLLGEEDKIGRQMQSSSVTDVDADSTSSAVIHDIGHIDSIIDELIAEDDISSRKRSNMHSTPDGAKGSSEPPAPGHAGVIGLGPSRQLPALAPRCLHYITVMEVFHVRSALLTALYETEVLYSLHRRQGKIMGLAVKKSQLGPIDFETRRTFAEVDDLEAFKDTSNPLEEILSVKTEMLASLSIGEFDAQMAIFDLQTYDGVRRLISHTSNEFRAALTVQLCTKNMLIAVTHCNMVAIDVYFETVYRQQYDRALKQMVNFVYSTSNVAAPLSRCRLKTWPSVASLVDHSAVDANSGTTTALDRAQLAKYFVSVNNIKSVFRKSILNEMSNRTQDIMSSKRPETLRKVLRELKTVLVREYCVAVTMATYQLATKYHCCTQTMLARKLVMRHPQLNFFVLGAANDVIRPAPRGVVSTGESRRAATCMITRSGRVDEARYLPNVLQILSMDYQSKDASRSSAANASSAASGGAASSSGQQAAGGNSSNNSGAAASNCVVLPNLSAGTTYLRSNVLLCFTSRVLFHWNAIMRLLHSLAAVSPSLRNASLAGMQEDSSVVARQAMLDVWRAELTTITNDLESLRDPNDTVSVIEYLEGKHSTLFLKLMAGIANSKSYAERYQHVATARKFRVLHELFDDATRFTYTTRARYPRMLYPLSDAWQMAQSQLPADERLKLSPYFAPLCSIKKLLDGTTVVADLDQALHDITSMPAAGLTLHRDEETFYGEVERNNFRFIGDEVLSPLEPLDWLDTALTTEERNLLGTEVSRVEQLVDESREDAESLLPVTLPKGAKNKGIAATINATPIVSHFELMLYVARRDRLRDLFFFLTAESMRAGWQRLTKAQKAATAAAGTDVAAGGPSEGVNANIPVILDDLYARTVLARGRVVCEKEAADRNDTRFRRKQKGNEKEVARRQYQLLVMEVNKLLMLKYRVEAEAVVKDLEEAAALRERLNSMPPEVSAGHGALTAAGSAAQGLSFKTSIFSDFCRIIMARAMCTRPEGERMATFHVPESSLTLAIDTVGTRLAEWGSDVTTANCNVAEQLIRDLQKKATMLEQRLQHEGYLREVDARAVDRRAAAEIADRKYELLFANGILEKQLNALNEQLRGSEQRLRESVRVEYQERISQLESELLLSEQRFQAFKKKTFRDVQASLEEIKRGAMLAVGKMENAPLHMKRQALRIAISDDELNTLKEQNAELKQAIQKTKIWYEIKAMRTKAAFEKKFKDATRSIEESRATFWDNKEATEGEIKQLKTQLSSAQYQLSQSEIEIEMLRKDLQVQLSNKKDLVSWKLQNTKAVEDLQIKLRKYEKWSAYDMDKVVADYEKRQQQQQLATDDDRGTPTRKTRGASSSVHRQQGGSAAPSSIALSAEEHKRLLEKLDREKKLKEQAFAKIDELKMAEAGSTEALVWQRKYFEAANELQKHVKELEATRSFLVANGLTLPITSTPGHSHPHPSASSVRGASTPSQQGGRGTTPAAVSATPSFELRPATSAPAARPQPPSAGGLLNAQNVPQSRHALSASTTMPQASRLNKRT